MAPDRPAPGGLPTAPAAAACPRCAARRRPGAPWCTQCFLDLRTLDVPAPPVATAAAVTVPAVTAPVGTAPVSPPAASYEPDAASYEPDAASYEPDDDELAEPRWPCSACGTRVPFQEQACPACGAGFLAAVQEPGPVLELPLVGDLGQLSGARRIAVALAVVVLVMLATALLGVLFS